MTDILFKCCFKKAINEIEDEPNSPIFNYVNKIKISPNKYIKCTDYYFYMIELIGDSDYFKYGVIIDDDGNPYNEGWYLASSIKFNIDHYDKIEIWKRIEGSKWDIKQITVNQILQLNGK